MQTHARFTPPAVFASRKNVFQESGRFRWTHFYEAAADSCKTTKLEEKRYDSNKSDDDRQKSVEYGESWPIKTETGGRPSRTPDPFSI